MAVTLGLKVSSGRRSPIARSICSRRGTTPRGWPPASAPRWVHDAERRRSHRNRGLANDGGADHLPLVELAVGVLEQDVTGEVEIEVGCFDAGSRSSGRVSPTAGGPPVAPR